MKNRVTMSVPVIPELSHFFSVTTSGLVRQVARDVVGELGKAGAKILKQQIDQATAGSDDTTGALASAVRFKSLKQKKKQLGSVGLIGIGKAKKAAKQKANNPPTRYFHLFEKGHQSPKTGVVNGRLVLQATMGILESTAPTIVRTVFNDRFNKAANRELRRLQQRAKKRKIK